jgi:hypothetical protein
MTYEEYRAARDAEEAEAEARRKAEREARRAAELAKTPEERQAELEAMPFDERYAREKAAERLAAEINARAEADSELAKSMARLASADVDPVKTWLDRVIPPSQRWFSWLMIAWLAAVSAIILIGR